MGGFVFPEAAWVAKLQLWKILICACHTWKVRQIHFSSGPSQTAEKQQNLFPILLLGVAKEENSVPFEGRNTWCCKPGNRKQPCRALMQRYIRANQHLSISLLKPLGRGMACGLEVAPALGLRSKASQ
jgi:hypothetical protein